MCDKLLDTSGCKYFNCYNKQNAATDEKKRAKDSDPRCAVKYNFNLIIIQKYFINTKFLKP